MLEWASYRMSKRGEAFKVFSEKVVNHLENYTGPQYGDIGEDAITDYSVEDCVTQVAKYCKRYGTNAREGQQLLDFVKMAHYAQCAHDKELVKGNHVKHRLVFGGRISDAEVYKDVVDILLENTGKKIRITVED